MARKIETWEEAVERGIQGAVDQGFGRTITDPRRSS